MSLQRTWCALESPTWVFCLFFSFFLFCLMLCLFGLFGLFCLFVCLSVWAGNLQAFAGSIYIYILDISHYSLRRKVQKGSWIQKCSAHRIEAATDSKPTTSVSASTDGVFLSKVIDLVQGFNMQIHRNVEVSWWIYKFVNVVLHSTSQTVSSFVVLISDHLHLHMSDTVLQLLLATFCIIASAAKDQ